MALRIWTPIALQCSASAALIAMCVGLLTRWLKVPTAWTAALAVPYTYGKGQNVAAWTGANSQRTILLWGPLLLGALAMLASACIRAEPAPQWWRRSMLKVRRSLQYQLGPSKIWLRLTDGLSVLDLMLFCALFALNVAYFARALVLESNDLDASIAKGEVQEQSKSMLMLKEASTQFGQLMFIDLWLLFLPIPRSSFLKDLTGLDQQAMIRYHKFLGLWCFWVLALHGGMFYIYWGVSHEFWVEWKDWGTLDSINNLAGTLSFLCMCGLVLTARESFRRKSYEWFYRFHLVCFLGFMVLACMHYSGSWRYFTPGLLLWGVDLLQRASTSSANVAIHSVHLDEEKDVTTLVLQHARPGCPLGDIHLLVPAISRWAWHPFTIAASTPAQPSAPGTLTLHVKNEGTWTKRLADLLLARPDAAIRATLPQQVFPPHEPWTGDEAVAVVVGGIGVTAVMLSLRRMVERRAAGALATRRVAVLWAARHASEFLTLDAAVAAAAMSGDPWLTLELFQTQPSPVQECKLEAGLESGSRVSSLGKGLSKAGDGDDDSTEGSGALQQRTPPAPPKSGAWPLARPRAPRPLAPAHMGPLYLAALHILTFFGGFVGLMLGWSWLPEAQTALATKQVTKPFVTTISWRAGSLGITGFCVVGLGLPYILLVAPMMLWRSWASRPGRRSDTPRMQDLELTVLGPRRSLSHDMGSPHEAATPFQPCLLEGGKLVVPNGKASQLSVDILPGRPPILAALSALGAAHESVSVLVSGPDGMFRSVFQAVAELNRGRPKSGSGYFSLHKQAGVL
uniref:FAD-binding FR-type domain-containing protein n=2 Tax=Auxenochlorella protothecoides TaxID=3075 RepID=A0A1D2A9N1_AUXPR